MNEPIFIVGSPRSGTTLLAAMMGAHSRLSCGPETHFFRWIAGVDVGDLTAPARWPDEAAQFVSSISRTNFTDGGRRLLIEDYQLTPQEIRKDLASRSPSVAAMLSSVTESFMHRMGKARWVEKTPDHLEHVAAIRRYFPDSPILRMLRDPRDVALSLTHVPWGVKSAIEGVLFWKRQDDASQAFFEEDSHSLTVRFEDLIMSSEDELKRISTFVAERYERSMLNTSKTGKLVNSRESDWKAKASQPADRSRLEVWRSGLTSEQNCLAEAIVGDRLDHFGYPRLNAFDRLGEVYPSLQLAAAFEGLHDIVASQGVRFWKAAMGEPVSTRIYAGEPAADHWLEANNTGKIRSGIALIARILTDLLAPGREIYWLAPGEKEVWGGWMAFLIKRLLHPHGIVGRPG